MHIPELADGNEGITNEYDVRFRAYRMVYNVKSCFHIEYRCFFYRRMQKYPEDVRDGCKEAP